MKTIATLAAELYRAFEASKRTNDETYYKLRESSPEWMRDAIREAHDGMLPDDWKYEHVMHIAGRIADMEDETADSIRDNEHETCDSLVDVYNSNLLAWVGSNLTRAAFVDDAITEMGWPKDGGLFTALQWGQYEELRGIYSSLVDSLEKLAEDDEATA
jgi:hypothetical protein